MQTSDKQPIRRGVVAVLVRQQRLLVIRRSKSVVAPGAYCFPGGGIEQGESEQQTLCRELMEELGVSVVPVRPLWRSTTAWNVQLTWWLAQLPADFVLCPNPAEVESVHWLLPHEIRALPELLTSNHAFLDLLAAGEFDLSS